MGLGLAWIIKADFNGYLLAGLFTLSGFAFFGKNPFNVLPIILGVYLYDTFFSHEPMKNLIAPLLFGSTLGPVVGQIAFGFDLGWAGLGSEYCCGHFLRYPAGRSDATYLHFSHGL